MKTQHQFTLTEMTGNLLLDGRHAERILEDHIDL